MGTAQVFSLGLGASTTAPLGNFNGDNTFSGAILLSFTDTLHLSITVPNGSFGVGAGFDWWFLNVPVLSFTNNGSLNFYIGVGGEAAFFFIPAFRIAAFARVPIGLDLKYPKFDIFFQVEPGIGFDISGSISGGNISFGELYSNGKLGFRYWFPK
jgi:hypothetical protein